MSMSLRMVSLLDYGDSVLSDPPCIIRSARDNANFHYDILHNEILADAAVLVSG